MRQSLIDRVLQRLKPEEIRRLTESINHGLTKPHRNLATLLPILIDGHHHISAESRKRIKSAIRKINPEELIWLAENVDTIVHD